MKCPYCSNPESKVVDSRPADESASIRRRRECLVCHKRFTTYETIESVPLVVIKRDGSRQAFDRNKLLGSMLKSCEKRSVSMETLENIASEIEQTLQNEMEREVPSTQIGSQNRGSQRSGVSRKGPQDPESKKRGQIDDRKS